jgi:hypothetical protein
MAKHTKILQIEITPEQFLNNCSQLELKEVELLIHSPQYQKRISCKHEKITEYNSLATVCTDCSQINP